MVMHTVAQRMNRIPFSSIRRIFERVNGLEQQGEPVIHLEIGRPDFDTPDHIKDAALKALRDGENHYTSNYGIVPLRKAIAQKLELENRLMFDPANEIIVTVGVSGGIMITMMALLDPGDEVLIPEPLFPSYVMAARMAGAIPVAIPTSREPLRSDLESLLSAKTRMLVVTTPVNPTGMVLSEAQLQELADFAIDHNLLVMSDEIYEKLIYENCPHVSIASLPGMRDRTVTLNGFSKSYAMTGWRLGYVAATAELIHAMIRIHQYAVVCANSIAQWGAIAALQGPQTSVASMVAEFDRRRKLVIERLREIPGISFVHPQGALYVYVDVSRISENPYRLAEELLEHARVAVVPWDGKHIRISYADRYENLQIALTRIQEFVATKEDLCIV